MFYTIYITLSGFWIRFFSQSVSLTQYVVLSVRHPVHLFQLASELLRDIVARRRSDYLPRGAIFFVKTVSLCTALYP